MKKRQIDPRDMMELAVKVMQDSIKETRDDGKQLPIVGAILLKPDGTIDQAYRSELRQGDHAEYTLIERKNSSNTLEGSILFTTLEPCAPGSRKSPKLSCAERIVNARLKEVWVGVEDPDPTVDRKGIQFLQNNGVKVQMFDSDLQETIREFNKDFINQALVRANEVKNSTILSYLEASVNKPDIELSRTALKLYSEKANIASDKLNKNLLQTGIFDSLGNAKILTGYGVLLFGKEPRTIFPQAGLLVSVQLPNGEEIIENFEQSLIQIPIELEKWIRTKDIISIRRENMHHTEKSLISFKLIREPIINALIHRDYSIEGCKIQLIITNETICIKSPGLPVPPIAIEQLNRYTSPTLSRNPRLHYFFSKLKFAEERGLGMKTLREFTENSDLPRPTYSYEAPYLTLTIYRSYKSVISSLPIEIRDKLNRDEQIGWQYVSSLQKISKSQYARQFQIDKRKAQRHLTKFLNLGLISRKGSGPNTEYVVVRS